MLTGQFLCILYGKPLYAKGEIQQIINAFLTVYPIITKLLPSGSLWQQGKKTTPVLNYHLLQ